MLKHANPPLSKLVIRPRDPPGHTVGHRASDDGARDTARSATTRSWPAGQARVAAAVGSGARSTRASRIPRCAYRRRSGDREQRLEGLAVLRVARVRVPSPRATMQRRELSEATRLARRTIRSNEMPAGSARSGQTGGPAQCPRPSHGLNAGGRGNRRACRCTDARRVAGRPQPPWLPRSRPTRWVPRRARVSSS